MNLFIPIAITASLLICVISLVLIAITYIRGHRINKLQESLKRQQKK